MEQIQALKHILNAEKAKSEKGDKTIQVLQKDLKLAKSAIKSEESSTYLNSDSLKVNTGKSQGNETFLVAQLRGKLSSL